MAAESGGDRPAAPPTGAAYGFIVCECGRHGDHVYVGARCVCGRVVTSAAEQDRIYAAQRAERAKLSF